MSDENTQKQILIRISADYHSEIKRISDEENKSMNQFLVDLIISNIDSYSDIKDDQNDSAIIEVFKNELEEKNSQIEKLHSLLNQQQQLSLLEKQEKEKILIEIDETQSDEQNSSFLSRWFK